VLPDITNPTVDKENTCDLGIRARVCSRAVQEQSDLSDIQAKQEALFIWISEVNKH